MFYEEKRQDGCQGPIRVPLSRAGVRKCSLTGDAGADVPKGAGTVGDSPRCPRQAWHIQDSEGKEMGAEGSPGLGAVVEDLGLDPVSGGEPAGRTEVHLVSP